jgi:hypothetical protein
VALLIGAKPVWLLRVLNRAMTLTMKIVLVGNHYSFGVFFGCFKKLEVATTRCEEHVFAWCSGRGDLYATTPDWF